MSDEPQTFGKYELIDRLGRGGMADVWRARIAGPQGFERTLVLKRILPHLVEDAKARQLFEREARVVSRLRHANIVQVHEFGEIDGEYYLAMEYVEGRDLSAMIRYAGAVPEVAALALRDTCRALAYAHSLADENGTPLRILHRDVSPSNIMLGFDGSVRLLDFGIAKAFGDQRDKRTVKGTIRGKFGYIAPEVIDGLAPDPRADLFAVGVVLHEALTGKRLFRGASDLETLALVKRSEIPLPSMLNPRITPLFDEICMRALERDRALRYDDAGSMADALDELVHEFRFGPKQLTDTLERCFPRANAQSAWKMPEDSGPHTKSEVGERFDVGHGTARLGAAEAAEAELEHRPTTPMSTDKAREIASEAFDAPSTVSAKKRPRVPDTIVDPPRARPAPRASGVLFLVVGLLAGGLVAMALLLVLRRNEPATETTPPRAIAAPDLATSNDLAEPTLIFPDSPEPPAAEPPKPAHHHGSGR